MGAMQSLWNDAEAAACRTDLELRAYTSRLLGQDRSLVLHGGGNTSVKLSVTSIVGDEEDILFVKGSGWDLETIQPAGFSPCRMAHLLKLSRLDSMSDAQMAAELKNNMTNAGAPAPSVEAILHALLPFKWVDHTHADVVVALTNTPDGEARIRAVYGNSLVIIPYVMPGFELAKAVAGAWPKQAHAGTIGMVLMGHGIFSFGNTARESYERMIALVELAERHAGPRATPTGPVGVSAAGDWPQIMADLRKAISDVAGAPMIVSYHADARSLAFARRRDLEALSQQGPATPDHIIRTKRVPMLGRDVAAYAAAYERYFDTRGLREGAALAGCRAATPDLVMLDPAPRVALDPELGLIASGRTPRDAAIAEEVYRHTMDILETADALGGWVSLPAPQLFDVEYWDLEQAKLRRAGQPPVLAGEVALVTGAASGIGKACVEALLKRGAAVVGVDLQPLVDGRWSSDPACFGAQCDITDEAAMRDVLARAVARFGGLDMLVLNAGIFPKSARIDALSTELWQKVMRVNVDANMALMRDAHPLLARSPKGGRVVVIGSKNVPAPGPGAAAYSASKAALTQLARIAALEWGSDRIRVNVIHPNAVFDTGLWTEDVLKTRAASYGLSVQEYKTNNVLHVEVSSRDVAELAAEMLGPLFARTTGAQVPIDGGNERVI